jgi:hypothetical protein
VKQSPELQASDRQIIRFNTARSAYNVNVGVFVSVQIIPLLCTSVYQLPCAQVVRVQSTSNRSVTV